MIAYVYRPKRQRNGKTVSSRIWRARLKLNGDVKPRDISLGVSDRQTAEQKLRETIRDQERTSVGLMAPAAQRQTFENPMEELVESYVSDLKALGRSSDHIRHVDKRLRRLMRECNWQSLRDATADAFLRWRAKQTQAPKTINEYHAVLSALFTWLRKQNRVPANPFEIVSKVDTRGKQRLQRRALNDDEARRLLAGPRKLLYLLAMHTGLRRGEINALHGGDFRLDTANPYWMLPAAFVKNRKEQPRPLHPELVAELQKLKAAGKLKPEDLVFPDGVPAMDEVREDFEAAKIPLKDERGHVVDFHALRTTYITRLQRAGVSPREAMELARHSDMRLTMKTYTDVTQLPLAATVRNLPSIGDSQIDSQTLVADGPALSPSVLGVKSIKVGEPIENIGENHHSSLPVTNGHKNQTGGERGIRTPFHRLPVQCDRVRQSKSNRDFRQCFQCDFQFSSPHFQGQRVTRLDLPRLKFGSLFGSHRLKAMLEPLPPRAIGSRQYRFSSSAVCRYAAPTPLLHAAKLPPVANE
jgi:integrase